MTTLTLAEIHALHEKVRAERPLVHNITNFVAMNIAANLGLCFLAAFLGLSLARALTAF